MKTYLIAAVEQNNGIGKDNGIPWRLKADMQYFKDQTLNNTVIMGRRTFQSLGSKPLPDRHNIVISSQLTPGTHYMREVGNGYKVFPTLMSAMAYLQRFGESRVWEEKVFKVFIIGGARLYEEGMQFATEIMLTRINKAFECDTFFPAIPEEFRIVQGDYHVGDDFNYSFDRYVKDR